MNVEIKIGQRHYHQSIMHIYTSTNNLYIKHVARCLTITSDTPILADEISIFCFFICGTTAKQI